MSEVMNRPASDPARQGQTPETRQDVVTLRPPADIFEGEDGITLLLDMPGVSRERLNIQSDRNTLSVEGDVEIDMPEDTESLHADVRATHYRRTFSVSGEQLDMDKVEANLKDGVLRIHLPKRAEVRPRRIEVTTG